MSWVNAIKANRYPAVRNKYKTIGGFLKAVKAEAEGSAVWARRRCTSTEPLSNANWQVNLDAITNVRPMWSGGALKS